MSISLFLVIIDRLFVLNLFLAIILVMFDRKKPSSTLAWMMVLLFIPIIGFFIYMAIGQDVRKRRIFRRKNESELEILRNSGHEQAELARKKLPFLTGKTAKYADMVRFNLLSSHAIYSSNNTVTLYRNGFDKFKALSIDIKNAKSFIHMEYYIIHNDDLGRKILRELAEAASRGVEVRLLYDGMGCLRVPRSFFSPLIKAGGKVAVFLPPVFPYFNFRINYRNHRKLCIVDGTIGFIGGFNIGNEYLGLSKRFGSWLDTHLRIEGNSIDEMHLRFLLDWKFASKEELPISSHYFPKHRTISETGVQIISSGPDSMWHSILNAYVKIISTATDHVYIETPYFIPDDSLLNALRIAALSGVDVRVVIPGNPDHYFVYWAALSYMGELFDAGVRFYTKHNGFIHSKMITCDGYISSVGTANFDIRSFQINFEVNAFVYDDKLATQLEESFINSMLECQEMTMELYQKRGVWVKTKESVSRLISPLL